MQLVIRSLVKACRQLNDPAVLRLLAKTALVTAGVFAALGIGIWWAIDAAIERWVTANLPNDYGETAAGIIALFVGLIAAWLWFRLVAVAVLQFFADEVVAAVEARHYPGAAQHARKLPFARDLANALRGMGRTIGINLLALPVVIALMITGIGPALVLIAVNGWLLGRELTDMAWLRHCGDAPGANPVAKGQRFVLGVSIAALMLVPFAGLIAPIVGAAAGTHLVHHAKRDQVRRAVQT